MLVLSTLFELQTVRHVSALLFKNLKLPWLRTNSSVMKTLKKQQLRPKKADFSFSAKNLYVWTVNVIRIETTNGLLKILSMEWVYSTSNLLWPSDMPTWQHRTWSTLAWEMACCLKVWSHYLNQHRFFLSVSSSDIHLRAILQVIIQSSNTKISLKITSTYYLNFHSNVTGDSSSPSTAYMHQWSGPALVQVMACTRSIH